jgi:hypothetical protein
MLCKCVASVGFIVLLGLCKGSTGTEHSIPAYGVLAFAGSLPSIKHGPIRGMNCRTIFKAPHYVPKTCSVVSMQVEGHGSGDQEASIGVRENMHANYVFGIGRSPNHILNFMQGNSMVLTKIHFQTVDAAKFNLWLKKWPFGTEKENYGLPTSLLPIAAEICGSGVKICFKGWPDPWLQECNSNKKIS